MTKAIFFDRDNTLIYDSGYIHKPEDVVVLESVPEALLLAKSKGFLLIVVSNQSGIGRGYFSENEFHKVNRRIDEILLSYGVKIDAYYFCPHRPDEGCRCRKPEPGMVERASRDFNIDLRRSYVIGDKDIDVELARKAGCRLGLKVGTQRFPYLIDAVKFIMEDYEKAFGSNR
jgi:D-glycero-D-manno-heptose 1,7-bisphosphate phosphatase